MNNLPNNWQVKPLGDICEIIGGNPAPKGDDAFVNDGLPFVKMKDVGKYHLTSNLIDIENKVSRETAKRNRLKLIKKGSILLPRSGSVALNHRVILGVDAYMVSHLCALVIKDSLNIYNKYLYFRLTTINFSNITKKTTGLDAITFEDLARVRIPLPPLPIQKQIAEILEKADEAKQKRKEANNLTDEFLQSVFIEMFGDPVKNPKGWERKSLIEIIGSEKNSLKRGPFGSSLRKDIFVKSGYLVYEQYHALNNDFTFQRYFIDEEKYKELEMFSVREGDLIVSCSGVYLGKIAILPKGSPAGIINQALLKITLDKSKVSNVYFIYLWNTHLIQKILSLVSRGSGIPNFPSMSEIKEILFPVPPLPLQQQFAEIVNKTEGLKEKQKQSEQELENLFQSLMQKAFKGKLVE